MTPSLRTLFALLLTLIASLGATGCKSEPKPGEKEFDAANDKIGSFKGEVGFGSDAAATELAKKFSATLKKLESENFEGGKDDANDIITKGNFLTYCHVAGSEIVFLVQAPNLDTYEGEVRKALFEIAWEAAQEVTGKPAGKTLTIALRGKLLYGVSGQGKADGAAPTPQMGTALDKSGLYAHFTTGAAAPGAAPAAKGTTAPASTSSAK
jgi:hypothetical protein